MQNDFSQLDAQSEVSRLAQITPEEQAEANQVYDEQQICLDAQEGFYPISPEGQEANRRSWAMLDQIHAEIADALNAIHQREAALESW